MRTPPGPVTPVAEPGPLVTGEEEDLRRSAVALAGARVAWSTAEAFVALRLGAAAQSLALLGIGASAVAEAAWALVVLLQSGRGGRVRERLAVRLVSVGLLAVSAHILVRSASPLPSASETVDTASGLVFAGASLAVTPPLAAGKWMVARRLGATTVLAAGTHVALRACLSLLVVVALALDAVLGWHWADPTAALLVAPAMIWEARRTWRAASGPRPVAAAGARLPSSGRGSAAGTRR